MEFLKRKRNNDKNDEDSETEEYIPPKSNDNDNQIQKLKNEIKEINKIITENRHEIRSLKNKVNNLNFKNEALQKENHKLRAEINDLKLDKKELIKEINDLKLDNKELRMLIEALHRKNDSLEKENEKHEKEIDLLSKFVFIAKLRKLLKKLLQYIIKRYFYDYMKYNPNNKKIYFNKAPLIYGLSNYEIIKAMNKMLEIIFKNVKENNFVDKEAVKNEAFKKNVEVFQKSKDFFNYFKIQKSQENIIKQLIPSYYFTAIDNLSFDLNIENQLIK